MPPGPAARPGRWLATLLPAIGAASAVPSCSEPSPRPSDLRLGGARFIFRTPAGELIRVHEAGSQPYALGSSCSEAPCRVELMPAPAIAEAAPQLAIAGLDGPWPTSARVEVGGAAPHAQTLEVLVIAPPESLPSVVRLREAMTAAEQVEDQVQLARDALRAADGWDELWIGRELARALARAGRVSDAADACIDAASLADSMGVPSEQTRRLLGASYHMSWAGDVGRSTSQARRALDLARELGDPELLFHGHYGLGLALGRGGDLLGAIRQQRLAQKAWPAAADSPLVLASLIHLAELESSMGRHDRALARIEGFVASDAYEEIDRRHRLKLDTYVAHIRLSAHLAGSARFDEAELLEAFARLPPRWRELGESQNEQLELFNLASAHSLLGDDRTAAEIVGELDRRFGDRPFPHSEELRQLRGEIALGLGQLDEAERRFLEGLADARDGLAAGASEWTWRAEYGLARVAEGRGDALEAATAYRRALRDRQRAAALTSVQEGRDTFLADRMAVTRDAARFFVGRDDVGSAVEVWDAERASILGALDALSRRSRLSEAEQAAWLEKVAAYQRARETYETGPDEVLNLPRRERKEAIRERKALRESLERQFETIYAMLDRRGAPGAEASNLDAVQAHLADDEALLFELPASADRGSTRTSSTVWISRDGARVVPGAELLSAVDAATRAETPLKHVYIVTRPRTPLAALPAQVVDGRPLLEGTSFSYLPYAAWLHQPDLRSGEGAVVVVDPEGDLPGALAEADLVTRYARRPTLLSGAAARRNAVLEAFAEPRALFHFAGHGVLAPADPWDSHLRLADGQTLNLEDVLLARPEADLVVLNGCETGARTGPVALFAFGLAEAFLVIGAEAVVATERRVEDGEASAIIERFYAEGGLEDPAGALQRAALWARERGLDAWDTFRLFGRR